MFPLYEQYSNFPFSPEKSDRDTEPDNVLSIFAMIESCTKPFPPINGELIGNDHVGGFIHFQCRPDFALVGAERALCQRNGRWSEETPKCKREIFIICLLFLKRTKFCGFCNLRIFF